MTVATTDSKITYLGDGVSTSFAFPYPFIASTDMQVYYDGTLLTLTTHYTVSGTAPYPSGANIVFTFVPDSFSTIVLLRSRPYVQNLDLVENDPLPADPLEQILDSIVMMIQQVLEVTSRSIQIPFTDPVGTVVTTPSISSRLNQTLGFDSSGNVTVGAPANAYVSAAMQAVVIAGTLAAARAAMGIPQDGRKNILLNGAFDIAQRGTSFTGINGTAITRALDRWHGYAASASNFGITQVAAPVGSGFRFAARIQRLAANTSVAQLFCVQIIRNAECVKLQGQTCQLSFYALKGANFSAVNLQFSVVTGTGSDEGATALATSAWTGQAVTLSGGNLANSTLTRYTATVTIPTTANEIAVQIGYVPTGTAGANDYLDITGVQFEVNSDATTFESYAFDDMLSACEVWYEKSFNYATVPATNVGANTGETVLMAGKAGAGTEFCRVQYRRAKARAATITSFNPQAANAQIRDQTAAVDCSGVSVGGSTAKGFNISATGNAGTAVGNILAVHWTSDAEFS